MVTTHKRATNRYLANCLNFLQKWQLRLCFIPEIPTFKKKIFFYIQYINCKNVMSLNVYQFSIFLDGSLQTSKRLFPLFFSTRSSMSFIGSKCFWLIYTVVHIKLGQEKVLLHQKLISPLKCTPFPSSFTISLSFQQHSSAPKGLKIAVIVPTAEDQMSQSHFEWENFIHPPRLSCVGLYDYSY